MTPEDRKIFEDEARQPKSFAEYCYNRGYCVDPAVFARMEGNQAELFLVTYLNHLTEYTEYRFDCMMAMIRAGEEE